MKKLWPILLSILFMGACQAAPESSQPSDSSISSAVEPSESAGPATETPAPQTTKGVSSSLTTKAETSSVSPPAVSSAPETSSAPAATPAPETATPPPETFVTTTSSISPVTETAPPPVVVEAPPPETTAVQPPVTIQMLRKDTGSVMRLVLDIQPADANVQVSIDHDIADLTLQGSTIIVEPFAPGSAVITVTASKEGYQSASAGYPIGIKGEDDLEKTPEELQSYADEVVRLVNIEREQAGLDPLSYSAELSKAAAIRAEETMTSFSHTRPDGTDGIGIIKTTGLPYTYMGENIAKGYDTPEEVVYGWMHSEGHRANILSGKYTSIGVGVYYGSDYAVYCAQLFIG